MNERVEPVLRALYDLRQASDRWTLHSTATVAEELDADDVGEVQRELRGAWSVGLVDITTTESAPYHWWRISEAGREYLGEPESEPEAPPTRPPGNEKPWGPEEAGP